MTSGLGAIFSDVAASYPGQTEKATALLVYPALFMGIGNLFSMSLALVVGRRPVFLVSLLLLVVTGSGALFRLVSIVTLPDEISCRSQPDRVRLWFL